MGTVIWSAALEVRERLEAELARLLWASDAPATGLPLHASEMHRQSMRRPQYLVCDLLLWGGSLNESVPPSGEARASVLHLPSYPGRQGLRACRKRLFRRRGSGSVLYPCLPVATNRLVICLLEAAVPGSP